MAKTKPSANPGGVAAVCRRLAQPVVEDLGLLLWDVRFVKEGVTWYLRVFIDREEGGVSIDDCATVSRRLDPLLDEADPISQSYCLEVCSPGVERELRQPEHFARFAGWPVRVRLIRPQDDGTREQRGTLESLHDGVVSVIRDGGSSWSIPLKETSGVFLQDEDDEESGGIRENE